MLRTELTKRNKELEQQKKQCEQLHTAVTKLTEQLSAQKSQTEDIATTLEKQNPIKSLETLTAKLAEQK